MAGQKKFISITNTKLTEPDSKVLLNSEIFLRIPSNCAASKTSIPFWKENESLLVEVLQNYGISRIKPKYLLL